MARKAKRRPKPQTAGEPSPTPIEINPFGPTQTRKIVRTRIANSIFTLDDGTKLLVQPRVSDIRRALKQYNERGQPLYFLTVGNVIVTEAPKKLMRPTPPGKRK